MIVRMRRNKKHTKLVAWSVAALAATALMLGCSTVGKVNKAIDSFSASTDTAKGLINANVPITIDVPDKVVEPISKVGDSLSDAVVSFNDRSARILKAVENFIKIPILAQHTAKKGLKEYARQLRDCTLLAIGIFAFGLGAGFGITFGLCWIIVLLIKHAVKNKGCSCSSGRNTGLHSN